MKKLLKLFLILVVMIAFSMNFTVFAVEDNTSENNSASATSSANASDENTQTTTTANNSATKSSTQVTSVPSVNDGELSISDILNILLIATGIVIILLAIAIFIKLK